MMQVADETAKIVAMLHDVYEDHPRFWMTVEGQYAPEVRAAVRAISRGKGESYPKYLARVMENPIARIVKIADLNDNLRDIPGEDPEHRKKRILKYGRAKNFLLGLTDKF